MLIIKSFSAFLITVVKLRLLLRALLLSHCIHVILLIKLTPRRC